MNRTLVRNALFGSGSFVVISVVALLTTPIIVRGLTVEGYGVFLVVTSLIGYYAIADLGLGQAVVKFVAEYTASNDAEGVSRSINSALLVQLCLGLGASGLLVLLTEPILTLLRVSGQYRAEAHTGLYLCALGFLVSMLGGTFSAVIMGLQRYDVSSKVDVGANSALNVGLAMVALFKLGLVAAIGLSVLTTVFSAAFYYWKIRKLLPAWQFRFALHPQPLRRLLHFSGYVFLSKLSNLVTKYLVQFIISFLLGPMAVALYAIPTKVTSALGGLLGGGVGVIFPFASHISVTHTDEERQSAFVNASKVFACLSIPPALVLAVFSRPLLTAWMGEGIAQKSYAVLSIMSLSSMIGSFTAVPNLMLMGFGKTRIIAAFGGIALASYGVLLPVFTFLYGVVGTAVGMFVATSFNAIIVLALAARSVGVRLFGFLKDVFWIHKIPVLLALCALAMQMFNPEMMNYSYLLGGIGFGLHVFLLLRSNALPVEDMLGMVRDCLKQAKG